MRKSPLRIAFKVRIEIRFGTVVHEWRSSSSGTVCTHHCGHLWVSAGICSSSFPWSSTCWKISFGFHISNIFPFFPSLPPCFTSSLSESVHCLSRTLIPWYRSLFSPLLASTPPPGQSPLLSVSSSKWVFRCQCQSVGGGDESVAPTVSLAMTISAHCLVSVGGTFSTLCTIDLSSHRYTSQQFVNMMGNGVSVKKSLFISAYLTFLLCHIQYMHYGQKTHMHLLKHVSESLISRMSQPFWNSGRFQWFFNSWGIFALKCYIVIFSKA